MYAIIGNKISNSNLYMSAQVEFAKNYYHAYPLLHEQNPATTREQRKAQINSEEQLHTKEGVDKFLEEQFHPLRDLLGMLPCEIQVFNVILIQSKRTKCSSLHMPNITPDEEEEHLIVECNLSSTLHQICCCLFTILSKKVPQLTG